MEIKVKIKDPILRSYLPGLFERRGKGYAADMNSLTGTAICTLARAVETPGKIQDDETTVLFYLSKSHYNDSLRNKHLLITADAEAKINAVLRKEFDTNFISFCTESKIQGFKLKDIISTFIVENDMEIFDGDIETLKKRVYRKELSVLKNIDKKLRSKAYSAVKKARDSMKNNLTA